MNFSIKLRRGERHKLKKTIHWPGGGVRGRVPRPNERKVAYQDWDKRKSETKGAASITYKCPFHSGYRPFFRIKKALKLPPPRGG